MMKAIGLDSVKVREDAKRVLTLIKDTNLTEDDILNAKEGLFADIFNNVRNDRFFKYVDAWVVLWSLSVLNLKKKILIDGQNH